MVPDASLLDLEGLSQLSLTWVVATLTADSSKFVKRFTQAVSWGVRRPRPDLYR
jgi:hypothetical protein